MKLQLAWNLHGASPKSYTPLTKETVLPLLEDEHSLLWPAKVTELLATGYKGVVAEKYTKSSQSKLLALLTGTLQQISQIASFTLLGSSLLLGLKSKCTHSGAVVCSFGSGTSILQVVINLAKAYYPSNGNAACCCQSNIMASEAEVVLQNLGDKINN